MKSIFTLALVLFAGSIGFAGTINCEVEANKSGVTKISFASEHQDYFPTMVVEKDGSSVAFEADSGLEVVTSSTMEEVKSAIFVNEKAGYANLRYKFFTRPEDQNPRGWSGKHGVQLTVILPPSVEKVRANCVRSIK